MILEIWREMSEKASERVQVRSNSTRHGEVEKEASPLLLMSTHFLLGL